jgi:septal ring factor EnvC (AmiA/AmiB activator)
MPQQPNPTATDLKTLGAVPGVIIQAALDVQRAEVYKTMSNKMDDVKESVGAKVDALADEMRKGFASIQEELGIARTERSVLKVQVQQIDTTTKDNHKKVSTLTELLDKVTDPKRAAVLLSVLTAASAWARNRGSHLLPWMASHPNFEAVLQVLMAFFMVLGVYYVLRALPVTSSKSVSKESE